MSKGKGFGKLLVGLGIGAGIGMLFAPKNGDELRKDLRKEIDKFIGNLKEVDVNEVKDEFMNRIEDIRNELEDLDKEKALKIAKNKSNELKKKVDELVALAKEKGTPVVESSAENLRLKAIDVTKSVLKKLEDK
ncbi:MAG: YtxH domain-containing protein [Bacilli bacterium]|nr:YtxH domain-containing protein [Bacilli bacterium]